MQHYEPDFDTPISVQAELDKVNLLSDTIESLTSTPDSKQIVSVSIRFSETGAHITTTTKQTKFIGHKAVSRYTA